MRLVNWFDYLQCFMIIIKLFVFISYNKLKEKASYGWARLFVKGYFLIYKMLYNYIDW